uniref:Major facilitator superfamily (MFS) profile domain-containing protein n=2 Tax=Oryza TaxID=4527 RepID=A0A0E0NVE9_ORYRU
MMAAAFPLSTAAPPSPPLVLRRSAAAAYSPSSPFELYRNHRRPARRVHCAASASAAARRRDACCALRPPAAARGGAAAAQGQAGAAPHGGAGEGSLWMVFLATAVAVCGSFEFGTCVGYSAPAQAGIVNDFGLSNSEYGVFGSVLTIGAMIGALTSGRLADSLGRKTTMGLAAIIGIVGWFTIYFANVPVFISEIAPKDLRGGLASSNQLFICSGCSAAYIIGALLSWRSLVLVGLVPCAFLLVGLLFIPESPRWLVSASGTFLGCFLTGLSFYFKVYYAAYSVGMGPVPWVIMSEVGKRNTVKLILYSYYAPVFLEIFSIEIKAIAGSLVTLVSWIGSFAISYSFNFLMDWNSAGTFFLFSAASLVTVLFVARLVPETKGKALEEIQESFT